MDAQNPFYGSVNGVLFNQSRTSLVQYPGGLAGSYTIPNGVTSIGDFAFDDCFSLTGVTIPEGVTSIGEWAFSSCTSLTNITLGSGVTSIGNYAFQRCSLNSVTIPDSVASIGVGAFSDCYSLTSVTIPNSVTSIGGGTFSNCINLTAAYFQGNAPSVIDSANLVFNYDNKATVYHLPGTSGWHSTFGGVSAVMLKPPILTITLPKSRESVSNASFNIGGAVTDEVAVSNVLYQLNNDGWISAASANNWSNWTAGVTLAPGTNTIAAYATDEFGEISTTDTVKPVYVLSAVLTVKTNGSGTVSPNYNNKLLPIGASYSMTAKAGSGFGFTGWTGSATTNGAALKFIMASNLTFTANFVDSTKPTLSVTTPKANEKWSNAVFTVTGKASDNVGVADVLYSLDGSGWTNANTANNWTNWTAGVTLTPGTNSLQTFARDGAGNTSTTNTVKFVYVLNATLTAKTNGSGTISPNYNNKLLSIGTGYSMTAKAAFGYTFKNWTDGTGTVLTNGATLKFVMSSNLTLVANFTNPASQQIAPRLTITTVGADIFLAWPTNVGTFTIQTSDTLNPATWANLVPQPVVQVFGTNYQAGIFLDDKSGFYRLAK